MRTLKLLLLLALISCTGKSVQEKPFLPADEMLPYPERTLQRESAPPGYTPYYISHYGRHGSRTDLRPERTESLLRTFTAASGQGLLTPEGDSLLCELQTVESYARGRYATLTPLGQSQHEGIARRLASKYPKVLRSGKVSMRSTTYPRCAMSMASFARALSAVEAEADVSLECADTLNRLFNFYNPAFMAEGIAAAVAAERTRCTAETLGALTRLFTEPEAARPLYASAAELFEKLYFVSGMSLNIPAGSNMFRHFPDDMLAFESGLNNLSLYLSCCGGAEWASVRLPLAGTLAEDIISRADAAAEGRGNAADFRFGHDAPLLTLLALLGVEGLPEGKLSDPSAFQSAEWIPMAANLQLIFYRKKGEPEPLVLVLHNEKAVRIKGLEPRFGKFYNWADLKEKLRGSTFENESKLSKTKNLLIKTKIPNLRLS